MPSLGKHLGVCLLHVGLHLLVYMADDVVIALKPRDEVGHVDIQDRIFVQVLLKAWVAGYLKVGEELSGVTGVVIVGGQHFSCHRLSEAAAARHAAQLLLGEERLVHLGYQPRLVDVLAVANLAESLISFVYEYTHRMNLRFTICMQTYI